MQRGHLELQMKSDLDESLQYLYYLFQIISSRNQSIIKILQHLLAIVTNENSFACSRTQAVTMFIVVSRYNNNTITSIFVKRHKVVTSEAQRKQSSSVQYRQKQLTLCKDSGEKALMVRFAYNLTLSNLEQTKISWT